MRNGNLKKICSLYRCKSPRKILAKWDSAVNKKDDIQGKEGCFNMRKPVNVFQPINKLKENNC